MNDFTKLFALLVLLSAASATSTSADMTMGIQPSFHFSTDMSVNAYSTISMVSGNTSTPTIIKDGDTVCAGSTLSISPTISASWASSSLDIVSIYPTSSGTGYYPAMIPDSTVNYNQAIRWLPSSTYDSQINFVGSNYANEVTEDEPSQSHYNNLQPFVTEPMAYNNGSGTFQNKEGGANVYCKGTLNVMDGSTNLASYDIPSMSDTQLKLSTTGTHQISVGISGIDCFAATVKHPDNLNDHPSWFWYYYYTANRPNFGSSSTTSVATQTVTINVQPTGGNCAMHQTSITASSSLNGASLTMVKVTMRNDGDAMMVNSVSSSDPGFSVSPFPAGLCSLYGIPSSICPSSNGFNTTIAAGSSVDLYTLVQSSGSNSGGTTLTFNAGVSSSGGGTCASGSSAATCSQDISLGPDVAISCQIQPPSLPLGPLEVAQFQVACQNLGGATIPCSGDDWFWADGLSGGFVSKDNTQALAYPTTPAGASGTLRYSSGMANCLTDITTRQPVYECELLPMVVSMNTSDSRHFTLNCFVNGTKTTPDTATYTPINGLSGSTSNSSTTGTDYTAPPFDSSGDLQGFGIFNSAPSPYKGAIGLSHVTVSSGGPNNTTNTNSTNTTNTTTGGTNPNGDSSACSIQGDIGNVFPGFKEWIGIKCGPKANETCDNVTWSINPIDGGYISGQTLGGTYVTITANQSTSGTVTAVIDGKASQYCFRYFLVGQRQCWEYS